MGKAKSAEPNRLDCRENPIGGSRRAHGINRGGKCRATSGAASVLRKVGKGGNAVLHCEV